MSVQKIIQEAMDKNPLSMKETITEELRSRVSLALEAKMKKEEGNRLIKESVELSEASFSRAEKEIVKGVVGEFGKFKKITKSGNNLIMNDGDIKISIEMDEDGHSAMNMQVEYKSEKRKKKFDLGGADIKSEFGVGMITNLIGQVVNT